MFDLDQIKVDRGQIARWDFLTVSYLLERSGLDVHRPAIVFEDRRRTYGELRDRGRRVTNALVDRGIAPMDRIAVVTRHPGGPAVDAQELVDFCRGHLASYKTPTRVVQVDELPRTASGKVQKSVLVERFAAPARGAS